MDNNYLYLDIHHVVQCAWVHEQYIIELVKVFLARKAEIVALGSRYCHCITPVAHVCVRRSTDIVLVVKINFSLNIEPSQSGENVFSAM